MGVDAVVQVQPAEVSTLDADTVEFLAALSAEPAGPAQTTSVRMSAEVRTALRLAKRLGHDVDFAGLTEAALRSVLADIAQDIVFAGFDAVAPGGAPTLGQLAWAAAVFDGDPLADDRGFLDEVAERVAVVKPDADGDDVLFAARLARYEAAG